MTWPGLIPLLRSGFGNLAAYLAAHVILCLVPAFFIAGGLSALIPKEAVTRFLGRNARRTISYPAAALAGSVLAVCSCTIVPLFAGIYKKGAGIGPAVTFLFFAPAANILALAYTGVAIGPELALARLLLSLAFGVGIGLIMALIFVRSDAEHDRQTEDPFARRAAVSRWNAVFLLVMVGLLLAGTLKLPVLTDPYAQITLPIAGAARLQEFLLELVPFDASLGEEGVSVQGLTLIVLLSALGLAAWKGFDRVLDGLNGWSVAALGLIAVTLGIAALGLRPLPEGVAVLFPGKFFAVVLALLALAWIARSRLGPHDLRAWLWESWRFVKQIFPLLLAGVFVVGVVRLLIRPEWIESLAGRNSLVGNLAGVAFGVFMYFPTLVEVPIAKMFLGLGMHPGPLLAYLMADPELSLQSIVLVTAIIGRAKAWTYVVFVALFSMVAGLTYGAWVDGAGLDRIGLYLAVFLGLLALALHRVGGAVRKAAVAWAPAGAGPGERKSS